MDDNSEGWYFHIIMLYIYLCFVMMLMMLIDRSSGYTLFLTKMWVSKEKYIKKNNKEEGFEMNANSMLLRTCSLHELRRRVSRCQMLLRTTTTSYSYVELWKESNPRFGSWIKKKRKKRKQKLERKQSLLIFYYYLELYLIKYFYNNESAWLQITHDSPVIFTFLPNNLYISCIHYKNPIINDIIASTKK